MICKRIFTCLCLLAILLLPAVPASAKSTTGIGNPPDTCLFLHHQMDKNEYGYIIAEVDYACAPNAIQYMFVHAAIVHSFPCADRAPGLPCSNTWQVDSDSNIEYDLGQSVDDVLWFHRCTGSLPWFYAYIVHFGAEYQGHFYDFGWYLSYNDTSIRIFYTDC